MKLLRKGYENLRMIACTVLILFCFNSCKVIVDSDISLKESLSGTKAPKEVLDSLTLLNVKYYSFDGRIHKGQIVINNSVKTDVKKLFKKAKRIQFPIKKVIPIVQYNWSDDSSMNDNNTSSFNYRLVAHTTRVSNHSFGRAIDINPFTNPAVHPDGLMEPRNARYDPDTIGALNPQNKLVILMLSHGWEWGGTSYWFKIKGYQDYQHIQKLR